MKTTRSVLVGWIAVCGLLFVPLSQARADDRGRQAYSRHPYNPYRPYNPRYFRPKYRNGYRPAVEVVSRPTFSTFWPTHTYSGMQVVADVQAALNQRGYQAGPVDGVMGGQTRNAVVLFQSRNRLNPSGSIDKSLLRALRLI